MGRHPAEPLPQCLVFGEQGLMLSEQRFEIHHGTLYHKLGREPVASYVVSLSQVKFTP